MHGHSLGMMLALAAFLHGKRVDKEDRSGTYVVREEIERAPVYMEPCNLVRTAVRVGIVVVDVKRIFL